jgi:hypothetical protein
LRSAIKSVRVNIIDPPIKNNTVIIK